MRRCQLDGDFCVCVFIRWLLMSFTGWREGFFFARGRDEFCLKGCKDEEMGKDCHSPTARGLHVNFFYGLMNACTHRRASAATWM